MKKSIEVCYCDFCSKSQNEVHLVSGPENLHICEECVELALEVVHENSEKGSAVLRDAQRYRALRNAPIGELTDVRVFAVYSETGSVIGATPEVCDAGADLLVLKQREKDRAM